MRNKIFMSFFFFILLSFSVLTYLFSGEGISHLENRKLEEFPSFTLSGFSDKTFQSQIESAYSDQLIFSRNFKSLYRKVKSLLLTHSTDLMDILSFSNSKNDFGDKNLSFSNSENDLGDKNLSVNDSGKFPNISFDEDYLPKGNDIYQIKRTGNQFVFAYSEEAYDDIANILTRIEKIAKNIATKDSNIHFYVYYIGGNRDINFTDEYISQKYKNILTEINTNQVIKTAHTKLDSISDFTDRFYKSDHHWNHIGQISGYNEIIRLILGDEEPLLSVTAKKIEGVKFRGSRSRQNADLEDYDDFYVLLSNAPKGGVFVSSYKSSLPEKLKGKVPYLYDGWVNSTKHENIEAFLKISEEYKINFIMPLEEEDKAFQNHYGNAYGRDAGLILYDFLEEGKDNLLMIVDSYSNPINRLIASHFNKTFVVDLRHFEKEMGQKFSFSRFIEENDINKVLIMLGNGGLLTNQKAIMEAD